MDMRGAPYLHKQISGAINVAGADSSKVLRFVRLTRRYAFDNRERSGCSCFSLTTQCQKVYACTHKFLNVLDYLNLRLTGEFVASYDSSYILGNR